MVPRMIGALTSYEAERRTIGNLSSQAKDENKRDENKRGQALLTNC